MLSMGSPRMKDGSPDSLSETFLKRSLFDSQSDSNTIELPPLSESDLTKLGEPFNAVWFTYLYFDVRSSRLIEECTEQLYVGEMRASFSPDVVHRLQHFIVAFQKSAEANPKFSEGINVLCVCVCTLYFHTHTQACTQLCSIGFYHADFCRCAPFRDGCDWRSQSRDYF